MIGVCGLVENMPDGNAQRPGDIVTSMSGQTIEVLNTDAEGRLVLCDAITWAQQTFKPKVDRRSRDADRRDDHRARQRAWRAVRERRRPGRPAARGGQGDRATCCGASRSSDAYNKLIDSPIADMKNVGPRGAGSITAAQFIQRFVDEGVKWAHLDIAGMVWADKAGATYDKGATGYGVRLLDRFVADNFEQ